MRFRDLGAFWLGMVVLIAAPVTAQAPRAYTATDADLVVAGQLGGFVSTKTNGAQVGIHALARWRVLAAGLNLQAGGHLVANNASSIGALMGFSWPLSGGGMRLDLLGSFGARYYTAVGKEFLDDDPGTSATLGYAGICWGVSHVFASTKSSHVILGLKASVEEDLTRTTREYAYVDQPGLIHAIVGINHPVTVERRRTVGATRGAIMFTFGAQLDL